MNFIPSSIKALALIHYITNYATKGDYNQYQRVMAESIVRITFNYHDKDSTNSPTNYTPSLDKFALKAFNRLSHDREMSGLLVACYLLDLPDHYSPKVNMKTINIASLRAKFSLILNGQSFNQSDDIVRVDGTKVQLCSMYEHYAYCGSAFQKISIYEYLQFVSIVKCSHQQDTDYELNVAHRRRGDFVQRPLKRIEQMALVVLRGNLSKNKEYEDAISGGHPETDVCRADLSLVLLSLFVPGTIYRLCL